MKKLFFALFISSLLACGISKGDSITQPETVDNPELRALYEADQADRQSANIDWEKVSQRDKDRQARVYELLESEQVRTSEDYANAAMVFQHGTDTVASGMAVKLMRKAVEMDSTRNKWLLAAAIDRDLMRRGEPQIYGTQYYKKAADDPWERYQLDSTQVTDAQRREYGVETLAEQREKVRRLNKKNAYDLVESGKSMDEIVRFIQNEDLKNSEYDLSENGINNFGYQLMEQDRNQEALTIFKLNTELYPDGFNTYDSYGEALVKVGRIEEGIAAYKKSLELNPNNSNAKKVLAELEKD